MRYSARLGSHAGFSRRRRHRHRRQAAPAGAQGADVNSAPNPYHMDSWAPQLPAGRKLGAPIGIAIDRDGKSVWVFERCGADTCEGSNLDPIFKFDASGKMVANFGGGMVNWPHGFSVDRDDNVWVTDGRGGNGKGHDVIKFSPDGKVLMTLGKPGVAGNADDTFNTPSDVFTGPNGDIFVADGHGVINKEVTNDRIVKFSKDGKFIKAWSKHGPASGELDTPHKLAIDSPGPAVCRRPRQQPHPAVRPGRAAAHRVEAVRAAELRLHRQERCDLRGGFQSDEKTNPGFKQGIRIGSAKDGKVTAFIPADPQLGSAEEVAADDQGNVFAGFTNVKILQLKKYVKN